MTFTTGASACARHVGRYEPRLLAAHADAAAVTRGDRALDVGCGPDVLLLELAQRLGVGRVAGVDPSQPFVEAGRVAVPGADVRVAPAERLPLRQTLSRSCFRSSLLLHGGCGSGVAEMRRVARRTVTSCVGDYAGDDAGARRRRRLWGFRQLLVALPDRNRAFRRLLRLTRARATSGVTKSVPPPPRLAARAVHAQRARLVCSRKRCVNEGGSRLTGGSRE